ncbi:MAG: beta-N-acetylglucosaminidase [Corynebacterium sp.]|nr:beta-N-acetylglucosaminidase [Corynebacterium sp.]
MHSHNRLETQLSTTRSGKVSGLRFRTATLASVSVLAGLTLSACGQSDNVEPTSATESPVASVTVTSTATEPTSAAPSTTSEPATTSSEVPTESSRQAEPSATETSTSKPGNFPEDVQEAFKVFGAIAPESLFAQFDSCDKIGDNNFNCSGTKVGQFQFSKSSSRASQTTQVLTELRSSTVLEDDGNRVIGWSTLGSTAVLTVADNRQGLVAQQMISTDQDDPEDRLIELGLYTPQS